MLAIGLFSESRYRHMSDRGLEFDQGVRTVMCIQRNGFAAGAEVGIVADGTLVTISMNVMLRLALAERTVAVDTLMNLAGWLTQGDAIIDRSKAMTRVDKGSTLGAGGAIVPVGACQTLVANTNNGLHNCQ